MRIVVCVRQGTDGEISPFDASAYELALEVPGADVILLSMGPSSTKDFLLRLTRLGAKKAYLLSDPAFAGADTLATAYTLSLAIQRIQPDLILCGRQTLVGDTAQTGPMLSVFAETSLITGVMELSFEETGVVCKTRDQGERSAEFPALLTVERIRNLRFPSILSRVREVEILSAKDLNADPERCGLKGSPTRVIQSFENKAGKRKCRFLSPEELLPTIEEAKNKAKAVSFPSNALGETLSLIAIVGEDPAPFAEGLAERILVLQPKDAKTLAEEIEAYQPDAVLWGSDSRSKELAAVVSAKLSLGLCADCTALEVKNQRLSMYRPALSGSIIAKIESLTRPAMATVRTTVTTKEILVTAGFGVREALEPIRALADSLDAELCATRKMVDHGFLPYESQVGMTGKTVCPGVYLAIGVSGAIHHIAGMRQSGTVIAINPDPEAPIFDYADYGIISKFPFN